MASQFDVQAFVEAKDLSVGKLQVLSKDELHEVAKYVEVYRSARKAKLVDILAEKLNLEMAESPQSSDREIELAKIEQEKERLRLEFEEKEKEKDLNLNINSKLKNLNWVQRKAKRNVQLTLI